MIVIEYFCRRRLLITRSKRRKILIEMYLYNPENCSMREEKNRDFGFVIV